jgi:hypothetical protein
MKLNPMTTSTQQQISKEAWDRAFNYLAQLKRPNPPTPEAVKRAQFVDKTYVWKEANKEVKPSRVTAGSN